LAWLNLKQDLQQAQQEKIGDHLVEKQKVEKNKCAPFNQEEIIRKTAEYVRATLEGEASGHDWWHAYRVWKVAQTIGKQEGADLFVVELAALLHDIADWKFHDGDETVGPQKARTWLTSLHVQKDIIDHVCEIIETVSFKGAGVATPMRTLEGKVVQDADRLDAIGAIGIGRCFAFGGSKGRLMYDPQQKVLLHESAESYKKNDSTSLNHFYEKLFLVKDRINTKTARDIAQQRHEYMKVFVKRFLDEWNGI